MEGIKIPVKLNVLQSSIAELQQMLSRLEPNSAGWIKLSKIINRMTADVDKIQRDTSKPFINSTQFSRLERTIDNIEDGMKEVQQTASRIKFSDLKLDSTQQAELKRLNQVIDNIKNSIKNAKDEAKKSLMSGDTKQTLLGLDVSAETKTYDELKKTIQTKSREVANSYQQAQEKLNQAQAKVNARKNAATLAKSASVSNDTLKSIMGDSYETIFNTKGSFKSGGANLFANYLKKTFELKESDVKSIRTKTSTEVKKLLVDTTSDINQALRKSSERDTPDTVNLEKMVQERKAVVDAMGVVNKKLTEEQGKIDTVTKNQDGDLKQARDAVRQYEDACVQAAQRAPQLGDAAIQAAAGVRSLRDSVDEGSVAFQRFQTRTQVFEGLKTAITNFMGFQQVLNLVKAGVREAAKHIQELDSVMNGIAIVTNMTTGDLWEQVDTYSKMASRYGVSIKGAYEVSKIYYQQGLETADVMTLTNETLKLSKISGMDYAVATDYMTTALRGFKMEMQEAATVVDVYSALAANTAVSQEELAVAMSKTASSLGSVGTTFSEASAMIGTMVAVTRESATNIGSAMKSIASRYGELTKNPIGFQDLEGEAYSFNKVDTALQSVGISMKTVDGQFRSFTDVIVELSNKWDDLDSTQQRYIATQFAGNRQQSRFLALVSNADLLKQNLEVAENSEDTGTVQALKSLDSIETKIEQVRVAYQQFYTTIGVENVWKGALDGIRNYIDTLNNLPKLFGKIPIGALAVITDTVMLFKDLGKQILNSIAGAVQNIFPIDKLKDNAKEAGEVVGKQFNQSTTDTIKKNKIIINEDAKKVTDKKVDKEKEVTKEKKDIPVPDVLNVEDVYKDNANKITARLSELGLGDLLKTEIKKVDIASKDVQGEITNFCNAMIQAAGENGNAVKQAFTELGLIGVGAAVTEGLNDSAGTTAAAANALGAGVLKALHESINANSPSPTVIALFRTGIGEAIEIALKMSNDSVINAAKELGINVVDALKEALESKEKISLNDFLDEDSARSLEIRAGELEAQRLEKRMRAKPSKYSYPSEARVIQQRAEEAKQEIGPLKAGLTKAKTTSYTDLNANKMVAYHHMPSDMLVKAAEMGGMAGTSVAIRAQKDQQWGKEYGNSVVFFSKKTVDPQQNPNAKIYTGDGYTPTLGNANPETLKQVLSILTSQPESTLNLGDFNQYLSDASHLFSLKQMQEQLNAALKMPFATTEFRSNGAYSENGKKAEVLAQQAGQYIASNSDTAVDASKLHQVLDGAQLSVYDALGKALFNTLDTIRQGEANGAALNFEQEYQVLKDQLCTALLEDANVNITDQFGNKEGQQVIKSGLDYIHSVKDNPNYDMLEAKIYEAMPFNADSMPAILTTVDTFNQIADKLEALKFPMERIFTYDPAATSGPNSYDAMFKQITEMEDVAFSADEESKEAMQDVVAGMAEGAAEAIPEARRQGQAIGEANIEGLREGLGTHSPSRKAIAAMEDVAAGIKEGGEVAKSTAHETGAVIGTSVIEGMQDNMSSEEINSLIGNLLGMSTDEVASAQEAAKAKAEQNFANQRKALQDLITLRESINAEQDNETKKNLQEQFKASAKAYNTEYTPETKIAHNTGVDKLKAYLEVIPVVNTKAADKVKDEAKNLQKEISDNAQKISEHKQNEIDKKPESSNSEPKETSNKNLKTIGQKKSSQQQQNNSNKSEGKAKKRSTSRKKEPQSTEQPVEPVLGQDAKKELQDQIEDTPIETPVDVTLTSESLKDAQEEITNKVKEVKPTVDIEIDRNQVQTEAQKATEQAGKVVSDNSGDQTQNETEPASDSDESNEKNNSDATGQVAEKASESAGKLAKEAIDMANAASKDAASHAFANIDALDAEAQQLAANNQQLAERSSLIGKLSKAKEWIKGSSGFSNAARGLNMISGMINQDTREGQIAAGALQGISGGMNLTKGIMTMDPMAIINGAVSIINAVDTFIENDEEKLERLTKEAETLADEAKVAKNDFKTLESASKKYDELKEKRFESEEDAIAYQEAVEDLASKYPALISSFDEQGNAIINEIALTDKLSEARQKSAEAALTAAKAEVERAKQAAKNALKEGFNNANQTLDRMPELDSSKGKIELPKDSSLSSDLTYAQEQNFSDKDTFNYLFQTYALKNREAFQAARQNSSNEAFRSAELDFDNFLDPELIEGTKAFLSGQNDADAQALLSLLNPSEGAVDFSKQAEAIIEINKKRDALQTAVDSEDYDAVNAAYADLTDTLNQYSSLEYGLTSQINEMRSTLGKGFSSFEDYNTALQALSVGTKETINATLRTTTSLENASSSSGMMAVLTNQLNNLYDNQDKENRIEDAEEFITSDKQSMELQAEAESYYSSLSDEGKKNFDEKLANYRNYTAMDIANSPEFENMGPELQEAVLDYLSAYSDQVEDRLRAQIGENPANDFDSNILKQLESGVSFSINDESIINNLKDQYTKLSTVNSGFAETYAEDSNSFITQLASIPADAGKAVQQILQKNGYTAEGLKTSAEEIAQLDIEGFDPTQMVSDLNDMAELTITNLGLNIQATQNAFLESWQSAETWFSKANSGMDIKGAQEWLSQINQYLKEPLDLSDLQMKDGQFYATAEQLAALKQGYIDAYTNSISDSTEMLELYAQGMYGAGESFNDKDFDIEKYESDLDAARTAAKAVGIYDQFFTEQGAAKEGFDLSTFTTELADAANKILDENGKFSKELGKQFEQRIQELSAAAVDIEGFLNGNRDTASQTNLKTQISAWAASYGKTLTDEELNTFVQALQVGGEEAVKVLKSIKGDKVSTSELEVVYNSVTTSYSNVISALGDGVGSIVTGAVGEIIKTTDGIETTQLADGTYLITSIKDLAKAYQSVYDRMASKSNATTKTLNEVYAQVLNANDQTNVDVTDMLSNASGMTYDALGAILTRFDIKLADVLKDDATAATYGLEKTGFGKVRLTDWNTFASTVFNGYDLTALQQTPEYMQAFSAYNESVINQANELNKALQDEFKSLGDVDLSQGTQQLNLSYLSNADWASGYLEQWAQEFNATYKDGILTVTENTDLSGFVEKLGTAGITAGDLLKSETEAMIAKLNTQGSADFQSAFNSLASNYDSISIEMISSLAKSLGMTFSEVEAWFENNGDSTYKTTLGQVQAIANKYSDRLSDATRENIKNIITNQYDTIIGSFESTASLATEGTTSMASMQEFASQFSELMGKQYAATDLFNYDAELNVFKLNSQYLTMYAKQQRAELEKLGLSGQAIDDYLHDSVETLLQQNIDIQSFLSATGKNQKAQTGKQLADAIQNLGNFDEIGLKATQMTYQQSDWRELSAAFDAEQLKHAYTENIMTVLSKGGESAVALVKQMKGKNATPEDLTAAYNAAMDPLRTATEDLTKGVGETVSGISISLMKAAGYKLAELDDGTAIIKQVSTSVDNMVAAYLAIYQQMKNTAGKTTADLNNAYAKVLEANSKTRVDALETLENADGMTYQAFADLLNKYNKNYEQVLEKGFAKDNGFGKIEITDFTGFADLMGWDINSPEYAEAYSNWVDGLIEKKDETVKQVFSEKVSDEISSLTEAKAGQSINVFYLKKSLSTVGIALEDVIKDYSVELENDILTINTGANIPGLIQAVAQEAAKAGAMLPEQMAELADTVSGMLSDIVSIIGNGIEGSMSNVEAQKLNGWYRDQQSQAGIKEENIKDLQFTRTADGLKLANSEATKLYNVIKDIDALQGEVVFDQLKDNLIATDDRFKDIQSTTKYAGDLTRKLQGAQMIKAGVKSGVGGSNGSVKMFDEMNGNVDLYNRNIIKRPDIGEDVYSTIETATLDSRNFETDIPWVMNITPIPPDAQTYKDIISQEELDTYVQDLMDGLELESDVPIETKIQAILDADKVENGGKGLIINLETAEEITDEIVESESDRAQVLHEVAALYEDIKAGEEFDTTKIDQYTEELALVQKIQNIRATTEDDSFKFMENDIPSGQNNPLNYFENWATAYEKMKESISGGKGKTGYMAYEDFYNIITEMGKIAELSGQAVDLGNETVSNAESAANLITKAAGALKVTSDGKLKVDLSSIGVDFKAGADQMNKDVDAGIEAVADSQIAMLDSMIKMLEVVVAMESLGDIDVSGDNVIDLNEVFKIEYNKETGEEEIVAFTKEYSDWRAEIIAQITEGNAKYNKDLADAMGSVKIDGHTLAEMIKWDFSDFDSMEQAQAFTDTLSALYTAALSDDFDIDNVADSVYKVLQQSGLNDLEIDVGDTTFYVKGGNVTSINWDTDIAKQVGEKFDEFIQAHPEWFTNLKDNATIQDKVREIQALLDDPKNELTIEDEKELRYEMSLLTGETVLTEEKNKKGKGTGKYSGSYKGRNFSGVTKEQVQDIIQQAEELENDGFDFEIEGKGDETTVTKVQHIGAAKIKVYTDENNQEYYEYRGQEYYDLGDLYQAIAEYGDIDSSMAGEVYENDSGETVEIRYNQALKIGYAFNHTTGQWEYKGQSFQTYESMLDYVQNVEPLLDKKEDTVINDNETGLEIITNGHTTITKNFESGETIYEDDRIPGVTFKDSKSYGEWLANMKFAKEDSKPIPLPDGGYTTTFEQSGYKVQMNVSSEGELEYIVDFADVRGSGSGHFTAKSQEELKLGLATLARLQGGSISADESANSNKSVTFTFDDKGTATVKYNLDGTVTVEGDAPATVKEEVEKAGNAALKDVALEATSKTVSVDASTAETTITLPESIDYSGTVNVKASTTSIDASGEGTTGTLSALPAVVTYDGDVPVQVSKITLSLGDKWQINAESIAEAIRSAIQTALSQKPVTPTVNSPSYTPSPSGGYSGSSGSSSSVNTSSVAGIQTALNKIGTGSIDNVTKALNSISDQSIKNLGTAAANIDTTKITAFKDASANVDSQKASDAKGALNAIDPRPAQDAKAALSNIKANVTGGSASATLYVHASVSSAKGNIGGFAHVKGNHALAGGTPTLMGELGPELVVSQGKYFLAGQNGAEFVDLNKDAIVFNHKQTERLMTQGMISSRGQPFTNEANAISQAKGNFTGPARVTGEGGGTQSSASVKITNYYWDNNSGSATKAFDIGHISVGSSQAKGTIGPAMASASSALAALKQLRAMWQSLKDLTTSDLAKLGGSGSGGGGGSSSDATTTAEWVKLVERWYNLTQKIASLESEITHQETLRNKISSDINKNGQAYYNSQKKSLASIEQEAKLQHELNLDRRNYYDKRVEALNKSPFGKIYTFDSNGQLQYQKGMRTQMTKLLGYDENGKANYTNEQKYYKLLEMGFGEYMQFDSNGTEIKQSDYKNSDGTTKWDEYYSAMAQAAIDRIDSYASETQNLYDSIVDGENKELELLASRNEILNEIRDNQIEVEDAVLEAVEDTAQRQIDELQETRDQLEESTTKYIEGLQTALDKERDMYNRSNEDNELNKLYRKRDILMRSGGSASALASLNNEISSKEQDSYFNKQQEQIDAIQEASDKQLERLDSQIEIATETLEYQKEYGLLWNKVYEIMSQSPANIAGYIASNNSANWSSSALGATKNNQDNLFKAEQYTTYRDDKSKYTNGNGFNSSNSATVAQAVAGTDNVEKRITNQAGQELYESANWTPNSNDWNDFEKNQQTTGDITRPGNEITNLEKEAGEKINYTKTSSEVNPADNYISKQYYGKKGAKDKSGNPTYKSSGKAQYQTARMHFVSSTGNQVVLEAVSAKKKTASAAKKDAFKKAKDAQNAQGAVIRTKVLTDSDRTWMSKNLKTIKLAQKNADLKFSKYKKGGMNYETGLAELHGTPQEPEAVLNAKQTHILREQILGSNQNSLMNLLLNFKNAYDGIGNTAANISNDANAVTIENVSVNMNISKIANDYDARRAGEQTMEEIMRIARKTGAANSIRR